MTALTQLRESARQEGIQIRNLEVAKSLFSELHLDTGTVQRITGLDTAALKRLQQEADQQS